MSIRESINRNGGNTQMKKYVYMFPEGNGKCVSCLAARVPIWLK